MRREYKPTLEERLSRLERIASKRRMLKNEGIPAVLLKIAPLLLKNLPAIVKAANDELPKIIDALEKDTMNDNADKINALNQFKDACAKVGEIFNDMKA